MTQHSELFDFAYFPKYDDSISFLAEKLAEKEQWDFAEASTGHFPILKNYLEFTYRRLKAEKKIIFSSDNRIACFNTGLITENLEDIFAFFEENKQPGKSQFFFKAFLKKSDNLFLRNFHDKIPEAADYFDNPASLIFNPKCELIPDIDHIIHDNCDRFPQHLNSGDSSNLRRQLIGAIDAVKKRVKTNYKIAVPQFYRDKIQLLLPLCLTQGSPNPDLALVLQKLNDSTYTSRTCLTLRMAYMNARLIVKPQSSWLKP
ncbi:MAG: DUF3825 domain-containing protein [Candidatus Moranbacteria bacterium]|nr:DUF3825 domain-containing protein [Candidatus Moranbacteria bacterium]